MTIVKEKTNEFSKIKKIIAVMSGKGGVGKSSVSSLLAVALRNKGFEVGILDADITGPSIPILFGINKQRANADDQGVIPVNTSTGIKVMSFNLALADESEPVVWRGPLIADAVRQFYTEVVWGNLDYLVIDLPPGTGDIPLTIMQSIPLDGLIVVTTPQNVVNLIVRKSIKMAEMLALPILGIVENMSYFECPDTHKIVNIFGKSNIDEAAREMKIDSVTKLPINPDFIELCNSGDIELAGDIGFTLEEAFLDKIIEKAGIINQS